MPIQFACTHCGKPIEVDDEYADRLATCPFCDNVTRVPPRSAVDPHATVRAQPAVLTSAEHPDATAADPRLADGRRRAARWGTAALVTLALSTLLCIFMLAEFGRITASLLVNVDHQQLTTEQQDELTKQLIDRVTTEGRAVIVAFFALLPLSVAAILLTGISLFTGRSWQGITAGVWCGLFLAAPCCLFGIAILSG